VGLPGGGAALFTDTVGFIQRLPTELVAAFRATLEEVCEADLLLHVVDVTHPQAVGQGEAVLTTLKDIGADDRPTVVALNKVDLLQDGERVTRLRDTFPGGVPISAITGEGLATLMSVVEASVQSQMKHVDVLIPYELGGLVDEIHGAGQIEREEYTAAGTRIVGWLPHALAARIAGITTRVTADGADTLG
jgi:GTP-binding protein HflX